MAVLTLEISDDLAARLRAAGADVARVAGLDPQPHDEPEHYGYTSVREILEFLAELPSPDEVLALHAAPGLQSRIEELLDKNRNSTLSPAESRELDSYAYLDHVVRIAKARAHLAAARS